MEQIMRKINKSDFNKRNLQFVLIAFSLIWLGCNFDFSVGKPKQPTNQELQKLVKETIADFTASVEKDDFNIIRNRSANAFQKDFSAEKIRESFKVFVERKDFVLPLLHSTQDLPAEFDSQPTIREAKGQYYLDANGKFQTKQYPVKFQFSYMRESGKWKLIRIKINT